MSIEQNTKLYNQIYSEIKNLIVTSELTPGTILYETDLSNRFGISRTPVREALKMLAVEGLVNLLSHRGAQVSQISRRDLEEAYEIRLWVECEAFAKAASTIDVIGINSLEDLLRSTPVNPITHEEAIVATINDKKFHDGVIEFSNNKYVKQLVEQSRIVIQRAAYFVPPGRYSRSWQEHRDILDALKKHDPETTRALIGNHILSAMKRMLS